MLLGPSGEVGSTIELHDKIAKKGSGRSIPLHADPREALSAVRQLGVNQGPIIRSQQGGAMTPMSIVVWFNRAFGTVSQAQKVCFGLGSQPMIGVGSHHLNSIVNADRKMTPHRRYGTPSGR